MTSYGNASSVVQRGRGGRQQSLFYRDLNVAPTSKNVRAGDSASSGQAAPSSFWRDSIGSADPPPPPCFTLDDHIDRTPEVLTTGSPESYKYSEDKSPRRTPHSVSSSRGLGYPDSGGGATLFQSPWALRDRAERGDNIANYSSGFLQPLQQQQQQIPQPATGGLLTLPVPKEIVRPEIQKSPAAASNEEGDAWVTIYGFLGEDSNSILREFEKCGPIIKHVPGPPGSNWLHIQYQSHYDAQRALQKNGMQLYGTLLIGVKEVEPMQKQALMERTQRSNTSFMVLPLPTRTTTSNTQSRPYYLQQPRATTCNNTSSNGDTIPMAAGSRGTIASPSKSTFSKIIDLVFGF